MIQSKKKHVQVSYFNCENLLGSGLKHYVSPEVTRLYYSARRVYSTGA